jgi:uncharacterized protein YdaU (DUF1376 family)
MNRFDFYTGDWIRDTTDLEPQEEGIYLRLIVWYYANEKPIPARRAMRISRATTSEERQTTELVLGRFFVVCNADGEKVFRNKKCDEEITKWVLARKRAIENGKKGGRPPGSKTKPKPRGKAKHNPEQNLPSPSPSPSSSPPPSANKKAAPVRGSLLDGFDVFWKHFPNRKSRDRAERAWKKLRQAKTLPSIDFLVEAIRKQKEYREQCSKIGKWVEEWAHPATWLNGKRWEDELVIEQSSQPQSTLEFLQNRMGR